MATRASDDTREQTVARLRHGLIAGRVGIDTFVGRVDDAYAAKTRDELSRLTCDLPPHQPWWRRFADRLHVEPPVTYLQPPGIDVGAAVTLGRSPDCDYVVYSPAVSKRHAELRRRADGWSVRDLGSRNGTRVNGWLVKEQLLADGDELVLGDSEFVFRAPA